MIRLLSGSSTRELSTRQRINALKGSIPRHKVKRVLRKVRGRAAPPEPIAAASS